MMTEHDNEPIEGLPGSLPNGERILWQDKPDWRALAKRAFHVRAITIYLGVILLWHAASGLWAGKSILAVANSMLLPIGLACLGVGLIVGLAWLTARSTVYTITNRRLVIRSGVALPMSINIPFKVIGSASFKSFSDGTGDLPVQTMGHDRIAYLHLWPHARPWHVKRPEPMLRAVPNVEQVSDMLAHALRAASFAVQFRQREVPETSGAAEGRDDAMASAMAAE